MFLMLLFRHSTSVGKKSKGRRSKARIGRRCQVHTHVPIWMEFEYNYAVKLLTGECCCRSNVSSRLQLV